MGPSAVLNEIGMQPLVRSPGDALLLVPGEALAVPAAVGVSGLEDAFVGDGACRAVADGDGGAPACVPWCALWFWDVRVIPTAVAAAASASAAPTDTALRHPRRLTAVRHGTSSTA